MPDDPGRAPTEYNLHPPAQWWERMARAEQRVAVTETKVEAIGAGTHANTQAISELTRNVDRLASATESQGRSLDALESIGREGRKRGWEIFVVVLGVVLTGGMGWVAWVMSQLHDRISGG